ncbi:MAG: cellulose-binding family [Actinoallomurus sp.]|nr:cellulose-binding family [Actinoallomurus sp.]
MGRHTKNDVEDGAPAGRSPDRSRGVGKVPLLPAVAGVVAIGAVVSAISTQQISLNFAGGPPSTSSRQSPPITDSTPPQGGRTARDDSSLSPRARNRASRGSGRMAVAVAFRTVSTWTAPTGFEGQATITNRGDSTIKGWTLTLRYPGARVTSVSYAREVRTGSTLVVRNPAAHPSIAPGRSVKVLFTAQGGGELPTACTFNGEAC